jgi:hypothetical protein
MYVCGIGLSRERRRYGCVWNRVVTGAEAVWMCVRSTVQ